MYVFGVICHPSSVFYIIVGEFSFFVVDKNKPQVPDSCQDKVWEKYTSLLYIHIFKDDRLTLERFFGFVVFFYVHKGKDLNNMRNKSDDKLVFNS